MLIQTCTTALNLTNCEMVKIRVSSQRQASDDKYQNGSPNFGHLLNPRNVHDVVNTGFFRKQNESIQGMESNLHNSFSTLVINDLPSNSNTSFGSLVINDSPSNLNSSFRSLVNNDFPTDLADVHGESLSKGAGHMDRAAPLRNKSPRAGPLQLSRRDLKRKKTKEVLQQLGTSQREIRTSMLSIHDDLVDLQSTMSSKLNGISSKLDVMSSTLDIIINLLSDNRREHKCLPAPNAVVDP